MFARTDRLLLRPAWAEDAPALAEALNDRAIARNLIRVPHPYRPADAAAFIAAAGVEGALPELLIFLRGPHAPALVGGIGLHSDAQGRAELGYWIARAHWGRGFATEAGHALVRAARDTLRLPLLVAGHATDNPGSGAVLRKLGFHATGRVGLRPSLGRGDTLVYNEFELPFGGSGGRPAVPHALAA